jgi:hypothetical protein
VQRWWNPGEAYAFAVADGPSILGFDLDPAGS